jgi:hypothetical protein
MHKLVYTDEQDLRIYESLPSADFKEFFMAYFKYKKGDKVELTDFTNPVTFALFNSYIPKLDKNEDTYNKKVQANKENGKKGGRPKKSVITEVENNEFDIPNCQIPNTSDLSPSNGEDTPTPQPIEERPTEAIKIAIEEEVQINNNIDNDMGTFIGYFKELNNKTTTLNVEEEFDNNSDVLDKLLDDYESIINHTTDVIAKAEVSDDVMVVYQAKQAKIKLKEISEKLIEEIDRTNFYKYINEKIEIKTKRLQVA